MTVFHMTVFHKPTDEQLERRYTHHPPHGDQASRYAAIRAMICETARFIRDMTPCCPEQSLAFNALDQAMFLANAANESGSTGVCRW